jgi:predicted TIM-barrel fold metal-dependent hydrolase
MVGADERITVLETRLNDLSNRAGDSGSVSAAAYEAELDALRSEMENLRGTAVAELEAARDQAAAIEENAEAATALAVEIQQRAANVPGLNDDIERELVKNIIGTGLNFALLWLQKQKS